MSPEIFSWRQQGSYHHKVIHDRREMMMKVKKKEERKEFESKHLGLADIVISKTRTGMIARSNDVHTNIEAGADMDKAEKFFKDKCAELDGKQK